MASLSEPLLPHGLIFSPSPCFLPHGLIIAPSPCLLPHGLPVPLPSISCPPSPLHGLSPSPPTFWPSMDRRPSILGPHPCSLLDSMSSPDFLWCAIPRKCLPYLPFSLNAVEMGHSMARSLQTVFHLLPISSSSPGRRRRGYRALDGRTGSRRAPVKGGREAPRRQAGGGVTVDCQNPNSVGPAPLPSSPLGPSFAQASPSKDTMCPTANQQTLGGVTSISSSPIHLSSPTNGDTGSTPSQTGDEGWTTVKRKCRQPRVGKQVTPISVPTLETVLAPEIVRKSSKVVSSMPTVSLISQCLDQPCSLASKLKSDLLKDREEPFAKKETSSVNLASLCLDDPTSLAFKLKSNLIKSREEAYAKKEACVLSKRSCPKVKDPMYVWS